MPHTIAATVAFVSLGAWPAFAARRQPCPPLLAPGTSAAATVGLLGLVIWFAAEIHGGQRGLAERAAATAQALWPLAVVLSSRHSFKRFPVPGRGPVSRQRSDRTNSVHVSAGGADVVSNRARRRDAQTSEHSAVISGRPTENAEDRPARRVAEKCMTAREASWLLQASQRLAR